MSKKKQNQLEEVKQNIIEELNKYTPGTPEYKAILENLTVLNRSMEEERRIKLEESRFNLDKEINQNKIILEERRLELDKEKIVVDERLQKLHNKYALGGALCDAAISATTAVAVCIVTNKSLNKRTKDVLHYEESGTISSMGGKQIVSNSLKSYKN